MPRGDGTGPAGLGPVTGRGAGYCVGNPVPGYANPIGGRGYGFGRGAGRGYRNRYYATGLTGWQRAGIGYPMWNVHFPAVPYIQPYVPTREQEVDVLKGQSKYLEDELSGIQKRLKELETDKTKQ